MSLIDEFDELANLGMPFRHFKAALSYVSEPVVNRRCIACMRRQQHMFGLHARDYLIEPCLNCRHETGLPVGWRDKEPLPVTCAQCGTVKGWPSRQVRDEAAICYDCLRQGHAAISHETEVGYIDYPLMLLGIARQIDEEVTAREGFETIVLQTFFDGSQSIGARVPKQQLQEMLRTPAHRQLQREYWPYHCRDFMTYLGEWHQEDFEQLSPGSGFNWFGRAMGHIEGWEDMWDWLPSGLGRSYVYTCLRCGEYKVFVDSD